MSSPEYKKLALELYDVDEEYLTDTSEVVDDQIECSNCIGGCCKNMHMELTRNEFRSLRDAGSRLKTVHEPVRKTSIVSVDIKSKATFVKGVGAANLVKTERFVLEEGYGFYELVGECGNLDNSGEFPVCGDYDNRPMICREFAAGSTACLGVRAEAKKSGRYPEWQPVEIAPRPQLD